MTNVRIPCARKIVSKSVLSLVKIEAELPMLPEILHLIQFARASERGLSK
jgi:hypothetical protein